MTKPQEKPAISTISTEPNRLQSKIRYFAPPPAYSQDGLELDEDNERVVTWRDFCDATSIHGLRYIGGNHPPPITYRCYDIYFSFI